MSILSYLGQARKQTEKHNLGSNSAKVLDLVGEIADQDFYSGEADIKIELIGHLLANVESASKPSVEEIASLTRLMIRTGAFDTSLEELSSLIARRREVVASERVASLEVGQHILISQQCRPKMLAGEPVEIVGFDGDKVKVRLRHTYSSKWRAGNVITLPRTLVGQTLEL